MLMLNNLTEEQRLSKAVVKIMGHAPYLSAVLMIGKRQITDDPKTTTAYTNGKDEFYSRQFVAKLNDAELRFLVLHEVYHKLYKHLIRLLRGAADRTSRWRSIPRRKRRRGSGSTRSPVKTSSGVPERTTSSSTSAVRAPTTSTSARTIASCR